MPFFLAQGLDEEAVTKARKELNMALDEKAKNCYNRQKSQVAKMKAELVDS